MSKRDGGPAFPGTWVNDSDVNVSAPDGDIVPPGGSIRLPGMTLRQWYAGQALCGLCMAHDKDVGLNRGVLLTAYAEASLAISDALIAEEARTR